MARTLIEYLDDLFHRATFGDITKLAISLPPAHGKSGGIVRAAINYQTARPRGKVMLSSYGREATRALAKQVKLELELANPNRSNFPGVVPVGSSACGRGFDLVLLDDPIKSAEEATPECLAALWSWVESVAFTRMLEGARIVLVCSRWHAHDPFGRIAMGHAGEDWTLVNIPAVAELGDPLGRRFGEPLDMAERPGLVLQSIRQGIGFENWMSLYQGHPDGDGFPLPESDGTTKGFATGGFAAPRIH